MTGNKEIVYKQQIEKLKIGLEKSGYSDDPRLVTQLKNNHFYHKFRRRMFTGSLPSTLAGLGKRYNKISATYPLLYMGFWSVYPVLFAVITRMSVERSSLREIILQYSRDIFEFKPYTGTCVFHVTIWPKVEMHSLPYGHILILSSDEVDSAYLESLENEWKNIPDFEKFGVLPPLVADIAARKIYFPYSKSGWTKYPPSLQELTSYLFQK